MAAVHVFVDVDDVDDVFAGGGSPMQIHLASRLRNIPQHLKYKTCQFQSTVLSDPLPAGDERMVTKPTLVVSSFGLQTSNKIGDSGGGGIISNTLPAHAPVQIPPDTDTRPVHLTKWAGKPQLDKIP